MNKQESPIRALRLWLARTPEAGALVGFLAVYLFFALTAPHFLDVDTQTGIPTTQVTSGIVAIGVAVLMISGEFDLSVGSILAVSALTFLQLVSINVPMPLSMVVAILVGLFMGLINGLLLVWTRIPSFIVTLGTLQAYRAIALTGIRGGKIMRYADYFSEPPWVYFHPVVIIAVCALVILFVLWLGTRLVPGAIRDFQTATSGRLGKLVMLIVLVGGGLLIIGFVAYPMLHQFRDLNTLVRVSFFDLLNGQLDFIQNANARMGIVWWALLALIFTVLLRYTRYGNAVFATGGNAGAARAQGVPVDTIRIVNFVISGGLCAVAGVIAVGRELSVFPLEAQGLELEVIAATVIGGALLSGGYGSVIGAVLGVLITGMLRTGLVLLRVPAELFQGATGVILIIAVILNTSVRGGNTLFSLERFRRRPTPVAPVAQAAPNIKEEA